MALPLLSACGGGGASGAGGSTTAQDSVEVLTCAADASVAVGSNQRLLNNTWNRAAAGSFAWSQCLRRRTVAGSVQVGWQWTWPTTTTRVLAYPELIMGAKPWDAGAGNDSRFPRRISATTSMPVSLTVERSITGDHNLAISLWLTRDAATPTPADPTRIVTEVMVWADYTAAMMTNDGRTTRLGEITTAGRTFDIWAARNWDGGAGTGQTWNFVAYVARTPGPTLSVDLRVLLEDAITRGLASGSDYIASFELGNEIASGSGSTWITQLSLDLL